MNKEEYTLMFSVYANDYDITPVFGKILEGKEDKNVEFYYVNDDNYEEYGTLNKNIFKTFEEAKLCLESFIYSKYGKHNQESYIKEYKSLSEKVGISDIWEM